MQDDTRRAELRQLDIVRAHTLEWHDVPDARVQADHAALVPYTTLALTRDR